MNDLVTNTASTTSPDKVAIVDLGRKALTGVAVIHHKSFPESAISKMGIEAIRRYYEWQLVGPHEPVVLGAYWQSELVGFLVGGRFNGALSGYLSKNRWYLAWRTATHPWLLFDSPFRARLFQGVRRLRRFMRQRQTAAPQDAPDGKSSFGVLAIAVSPDCQGRGVGKLLMAEAERRAEQSGHERMHLTVHPHNGQALQFYERIGWCRIPNDENWRGRMQKELRRTTPDMPKAEQAHVEGVVREVGEKHPTSAHMIVKPSVEPR